VLNVDGVRSVGYAERARFYEIDYDEPADVKFLRALAAPPVSSVLEIPCGAGKNTLELIRAGLRLVAVDREPEMVKRVHERAAGRVPLGTLRTVVGDLRTLDLDEAFELILVQREAFQMILEPDEALASLRCLGRHLVRNGRIMIDLATFTRGPDAVTDAPSTYFDPEAPDGVEIFEWSRPVPNGGLLERSRVQRSLGSSRIAIELFHRYRAPSGEVQAWHSEIVLRVYSCEEFLALVDAAGLSCSEVARNYLREPYRLPTARMIFFLGTQRRAS
jgi:SAM-dependent methyltransferase